MIGLEEGIFPHSRAVDSGDIEEERRLCYVGITRARERLYLTHAAAPHAVRRAPAGTSRSRFLDEIPPEHVEIAGRDRRTADPSAREAAPAASGWSARRAADRRQRRLRRRRQTGGRLALARFKIGDDVEHANFGEGVVIGVEPGNMIVVRFTSDGSERKFIADYAPITKRASGGGE